MLIASFRRLLPFAGIVIVLLAFPLVGSAAHHAKPAARHAAPDSTASLQGAIKLYNQGKYLEADHIFSPFADKHPRDRIANFYAARCKESFSDAVGAAPYMSRVAVGSYQRTNEYNQAVAFFRKYGSALNNECPYSCVVEGYLMRWSNSRPVRVFISDGWQLPSPYAGGDLAGATMHELEALLDTPGFYRSVGRCPGYERWMHDCAVWGIGQWDWAKSEKLINYQLVTDPTKADIFIFWCPQLSGGKAGVTSFNIPGRKMIIEIATQPPVKMERAPTQQLYIHTCSHEFGHALGVQHSHSNTDLMAPCGEAINIYVGRGVGNLPKGMTKNDKATLRTFYKMPADYYFNGKE